MAGWKVAIFQFLEVDSRARDGFDEEQHEEINSYYTHAHTAAAFFSLKEGCCIFVNNQEQNTTL